MKRACVGVPAEVRGSLVPLLDRGVAHVEPSGSPLAHDRMIGTCHVGVLALLGFEGDEPALVRVIGILRSHQDDRFDRRGSESGQRVATHSHILDPCFLPLTHEHVEDVEVGRDRVVDHR